MDIRASLKKIKETRPKLSLSTGPDYPDHILDYFNYYSIHQAGITHHFGYFNSSGFELAAHIFIPEHPAKTVILMHGYYDHSGSLKHIISYLLTKNCTVAVYDMPGHGLSSGSECQIDHFQTYGIILDDFIQFCHSQLKNPVHVITHSAGSISMIELLLTGKKIPVSSVILTAPLVHTKSYPLIKIVSKPIGLFTKKLTRKFNKSSSDPGFYNFLTHDPLQSKTVYLSWVNQLVSWNRRITDLKPVSNRILIIQGDQDRTIDSDFNLNFLRIKFPNSILKMVRGCRHQLLNEKKEIRNTIFSMIHNYVNCCDEE